MLKIKKFDNNNYILINPDDGASQQTLIMI